MVQIVGTYKLERNENLDEFYQKVGVPWIARKMMTNTSPTMYITKDDDEQWVFKTVTFLKTVEISFKLDEPYDETMPSGDEFASVTTMEGDNKFTTTSKTGDDVAFERSYEFNEEGMVMTLTSKKENHEAIAKRYFKRVQ